MLLLVAGCAIASFIVNRDARRVKKRSAEAPKKPKAIVYHDYDQYRLARQAWLDRSRSFTQQEAARLAALETKLKQSGVLSGLGCVGFILFAFVVGTAAGAGAGWGTVIVGLFVVGLLSACEQQYRRWRWRDQFKPRVFADAVPEPVYEEPPRQSSPPPTQEPPPRRESAPSPPPVAQVRVTSLRQAFEILEMQPGRTTLSIARAAYRARMTEYHPDKTLHLGKELRELAARKALEINLAMKFIEVNCTTDPTASDQSDTGPSEPPGPKTEPATQGLINQILRLKNAVPFRPFSIKTRQNDRLMSSSDKSFFIRYPDWVSLKDETSIVLRYNDADHKCVIPLREIEQVCLGGNETETRWENASDQKAEQARSGNENGSIYPEDSIVSAPEDDPRRIFLRGPFDGLDDDAFCDPYVLDLDYIEQHGHSYISINSWRGRIPYGTEEDALLGNEILELASQGGWDRDNDYPWEEVYCGGADVIPHYATRRVAAGLRAFLRTAPNEIEFEGRRISRDLLLRAADILEAGPTTIPW